MSFQICREEVGRKIIASSQVLGHTIHHTSIVAALPPCLANAARDKYVQKNMYTSYRIQAGHSAIANDVPLYVIRAQSE